MEPKGAARGWISVGQGGAPMLQDAADDGPCNQVERNDRQTGMSDLGATDVRAGDSWVKCGLGAGP